MIRITLASSGLLLVLFLIIHLAGLVVAVIAPTKFELYAAALHSASWMNLLECGLLVVALIHMSLTIKKVMDNFQASNSPSLVSRRKDYLAVLAARSQPLGGICLLSFLLIHINQLRFPRPLDGAELSTLHFFLESPITLIIYFLGSIALFLHLFHGIESSHRSLGLLTSENALLIRNFGRSLSLLIGLGFVLVTGLLGGIIFAD